MTQAELVEFYRSHFLFEHPLDRKYFMYELAVEAPTDMDRALANSWANPAKMAKTIYPVSPPEPTDPEAPIRIELSVTAPPKRERNWRPLGFARKESAKRPATNGPGFGLIGSGVQLAEKPSQPETVPLSEEQSLKRDTSDLIFKLVGSLSPDSSPERLEDKLPELPDREPAVAEAASSPEEESEPVPEPAKAELPAKTQEDEEYERLFGSEEGEINDSEAAASAPPADKSVPPPSVLEESSDSEDKQPALRRKNVYTFNGFEDKSKPIDRQMEIVPRTRREAAKPKRLYDEMLDDLVLVGEGENERLLDKKLAEARAAKNGTGAKPSASKPRGPSLVDTSQRIALPSEINSRMMNPSRFMRDQTQDTEMFQAYEAMFRVSINQAAVAFFDDNRKYNTSAVEEFQRIIYQKVGTHLLAGRPVSKLMDVVQENEAMSNLEQAAWFIEMCCWAYRDMNYEEDANPGSQLSRVTFASSRVKELEGSQQVFVYNRSANDNLFAMRAAFWPYLHLQASAHSIVAQHARAVKTVRNSAEIVKLLVGKRSLVMSLFINWVNAVILIGYDGIIFQTE